MTGPGFPCSKGMSFLLEDFIVHSEKECSKIFLFLEKSTGFFEKNVNFFLIFINHIPYKTTCFKDKKILRKTVVLFQMNEKVHSILFLNGQQICTLFLPAGLPLPSFLHDSFLFILQKLTDDAQGKFYGNSSTRRCLTAFALPNVSEVVAACTKHVLASMSLTVGILSNHVVQPQSLGFMLL